MIVVCYVLFIPALLLQHELVSVCCSAMPSVTCITALVNAVVSRIDMPQDNTHVKFGASNSWVTPFKVTPTRYHL